MKCRLFLVGVMVTATCLPVMSPLALAGTLEEDAMQAEVLIRDGKLADAAALFVSMLERAPDNPAYLGRYALVLYVQGRGDADPARQRELYKKSRLYAQRAQKADPKDPLMAQLLASISEEGDDLSIQKFSDNKEVNDAIQLGETAFARHDYAAAAAHYQRALNWTPDSTRPRSTWAMSASRSAATPTRRSGMRAPSASTPTARPPIVTGETA